MTVLCTKRRAERFVSLVFFFFNDTATTEIYTLSLHDALPISYSRRHRTSWAQTGSAAQDTHKRVNSRDRKSTRLNSSHSQISYAVFCLKKKKKSTPDLRVPDTRYSARADPS